MARSHVQTASHSLPAGGSAQPETEQRKFFLFGHPIAHSFSPLLHTQVFSHLRLPWTYTLEEGVNLDAFLLKLRSPDCWGSSVTMPHKVAILPHLDALTEEGRDVGACNTVFVQEGIHPSTGDKVKRYIGTNTDVVGVRDALFKAVDKPQHVFYGKPALVIGGGGAARSAVYALRKYLHASHIYLINRLDSEVSDIITECEARGFGYNLIHVKTPEDAAKLAAPAAVVACVPDIEPKTPEELQARATTDALLHKHDKGVWLEMAYHPTIWTGLALAAKDAGWQVVLGTEAMIWQGLEQDRLWTGRHVSDMGVEQVRKLVNEAVERSNAAHSHR